MKVDVSSSIAGIVYLTEPDYGATGFHNLTITAENHVTPERLTVTERIDVLFRIDTPTVEIYTPTWDTFLVHPSDLIQLNVSVEKASRMRTSFSCSRNQGVCHLNQLYHMIAGRYSSNIMSYYCSVKYFEICNKAMPKRNVSLLPCIKVMCTNLFLTPPFLGFGTDGKNER